MSELLHPGDGLIFMKVGTHAQEPLDQIIGRKQREIAEAGYALWGYGGNTCHPLRVQPFVRDYERRGKVIYLCMEPMTSRHFAPQTRAVEMSRDGVRWEEIPSTVNVLGSRYALAIDSLEERKFNLPLGKTKVAVGALAGTRGDEYISGRVDKACLEFAPEGSEVVTDDRAVGIGLVARIVQPAAVLLR